MAKLRQPEGPQTERQPPGREGSQRHSQRLNAALRDVHAGRHRDAEAVAAGVLKSDPANTFAAQVLAMALLGQGRAGEAVAPLGRAAGYGPDAAIETLLGIALSRAGRADEAIASLRLATSRRPAFTPAFVELAAQLDAAGRADAALGVLEDGLALSPGAGALLFAIGTASLRRNDRARARRKFQAAHAAEPDRTGGLVGLARVNALEGDHAAAADCCRRALALRPDDLGLQMDLAAALLEAGAREEGEALLHAAAGDSPLAAAQGAVVLAASAHGRGFLQPSRALEFMTSAEGSF